MIFVCLGTNDKSFERLLVMVDEAIEKGVIQEEVIAQCGCTKYSGKRIKTFNYCTIEEMNEYLKQASLIITHGGTGTIVQALKLHKKVIAVSRLGKYKEHENDHQIQIISQFVDTGYISGIIDETTTLEEKLEEAKTFETKEFVSNTENFLNYLRSVIDETLDERKKKK